jgi:hypothetical protein
MRKHVAFVTAIAGAALFAATVSTAQDEEPQGFTFAAALSGAQEVTPPEEPTTPSPGVETDTTGSVQVIFAQDLSQLSFALTVQNGKLVTQAHLHCGRAGVNGPIVVFLSALNAEGADVNGLLAEGTRTNTDLEEGAAQCEEVIGRPVRNIASLAAAAAEGLIYANVHSVANPAGEVRGQLILD